MDDSKHTGVNRMSITYRLQQDSPLTWLQLDNNFRAVEDATNEAARQAQLAEVSVSDAKSFSEEARQYALDAGSAAGVEVDALKELLLSQAGAGEIGFNGALSYGAGSVGASLSLLLKRAVFVSPLGGGADDAPAINAAAVAAGPSSDLFFDPGEYLIRSKLTQLQGQAWHGSGGQRSTTIRKGADIDMMETATLGAIFDINFEGEGATYSGKGVLSVGYSVSIERVRVNLTRGSSLSFPGIAGGTNIRSFEGSTTDPAVVPAIDFMGVSTVRPIFIDGVWLSGGFIDVSNSGNGCSMSNFYITNIKTGAGFGLMHFSNGRVGASGANTTITGGESTFCGVAFAGIVNLVSAQGMKFPGCSAVAFTEDAASNSNEFSTKALITPAWTQASGSGPYLGNGTLTMNYARNGNLITCQLQLVFGSTTTAGDGAAGWNFELPFTGTPNLNASGMVGVVFDASASTDYIVSGQIPGNTKMINFGRNGAGVRAGTPMVWAAGDKLDCTFTYLAR